MLVSLHPISSNFKIKGVLNTLKSESDLLLSPKNAATSGAPYGSNPVSATLYSSFSEEEWRASSPLETEERFIPQKYATHHYPNRNAGRTSALKCYRNCNGEGSGIRFDVQAKCQLKFAQCHQSDNAVLLRNY